VIPDLHRNKRDGSGPERSISFKRASVIRLVSRSRIGVHEMEVRGIRR
jgi:hypothetical protein